MSKQKFSAAEREALWSAHNGKCAYTRRLLDMSSFHIDHILPESCADDTKKLAEVIGKLGLSADFDIFGYENLVPVEPGLNLQKGQMVFDLEQCRFYLALAMGKKADIESSLEKIKRRQSRGKALVLLQEALENGKLQVSEVATILDQHSDKPDDIFTLLEKISFADASEVDVIKKADIASLRDRPVRLGANDDIDGVTLNHDSLKERHIRTCREYDQAINEGFYPKTNFDSKMATFFLHQSGLLNALERAALPIESFISAPRVGIVDLHLLPFRLFPRIADEVPEHELAGTYQDKISDGIILVKEVRQNLLAVTESAGLGQQLIEVARADFNGDGIEDILLFEYVWATHGTLGFGGIRIITRKSADGQFEEVSL